MADKTIQINRAPVLTLWAAIVAQRLGFDRDESLSLGKALAGLTAQSKGRRLGIYKPSDKKEVRKKKHGEEFYVALLGRNIPAQNTPDGIRAVSKDRPVSAESAQRYLESKFGDDLKAATEAMRELARAHKPKELESSGFGLYERFRPAIPSGKKGWGAKGDLKLSVIRKLAREA